MTAAETVLLDLGAWAPKLVQTATGFEFQMPVESGIVSWSLAFAVSAEQARVLCADEQRCHFLWAALHHPHQLGRLSRAEVETYLQRIVSGPCAEAEAFLSQLDLAANRAISNHVRIMLGRDQAAMIAGRWFLPRAPK
ncbi:hypothetical protein EGN72_10235 [Pseudorhodobacter sp. E13]|uniref:hypothetical protein n=1 Tax=Pseudorhodobacter sp. E13 TaxID=2487931 RepID=UPI000F8E5F39|nr:hypothetical protein [Pseudorhodobacter sp. E13]RUS60172.1 hypothetical protein EGN72_10235 [Pseudorhodobacter sp. E13]